MPVTHSEFSLINKYFKSRSFQRQDVSIGIGDDAAVTSVPGGRQLVTTVDTLVEDIHFPKNTSAYSIGYKSLAVSLSDLAAMGAEPAWATLALTMPSANEGWIKLFCDGFFQLLDSFEIQLIGGDTTQGPLSITVQLMGLVPENEAIKRSGAKTGDLIYVSGTLGDAAAALKVKQQKSSSPDNSTTAIEQLFKRLGQPTPRVELGIQLRKLASSAIDLSDGLVADLSHVLEQSNVGAMIYQDKLPLSDAFSNINDPSNSLELILHGGDDYELCFTICAENQHKINEIALQLNTRVTEIGTIEAEKGLRMFGGGICRDLRPIGYQHFSNS